MREVSYGTSSIAYSLEFSDRKTLAIEVHPDLQVHVVAPRDTLPEQIEEKLLKRAIWIKKQQRFFDQFLPHIPTREYVAGETHYYLGRGYSLRLLKSDKREVKLKNGNFEIQSPNHQPEAVRALLASWYFNHAILKFKEAFEIANKRMSHLEIGTPDFAIRKMKNRWGSCTATGQILLNPDLIRAPFNSILYVCLHELCHLIEPTHQKSFFILQESVMPDWERWKNKLELFAYSD